MLPRITVRDPKRMLRCGALVLPLLTAPALAAPVSEEAAARPAIVAIGQRVALFIRGGCPYNLDKVCHRTRSGRMACRCAS